MSTKRNPFVNALLVVICVALLIGMGCAKADTSTASLTTTKAQTTNSVATTTTTAATVVSSTTAVPRKPQGTLTVVLSDMATMTGLPYNASNQANTYQSVIYEYLAYLDKDGILQPMLATKWEHSPDAKKWTFYLRKGVTFHEGWGEMTADDVKYSIEMHMLPAANSTLSSGFRTWMDSIVVDNPYQITINLKQTQADLDYQLSNAQVVGIISKKYIDSVGLVKAEEHPIGTAPFHFVSRVPNDSYTLEALDQHWRQVPYFKTLVLKKVAEPATRIAMVKAGEADIIDIDLPYKDEATKAGLKTMSDINSYSIFMQLTGQWLPSRPTYDPTVPWAGPDPAKALKVRQALTMAIDQNAIKKGILRGEGVPAGVGFFKRLDFAPPAYDPAGAKKLLAEAGYPNGFAIPVWLNNLGGGVPLPDVGQAVATYWEKIGVTITQKPADYFAVVRPDIMARKTPGVGIVWRSVDYTRVWDGGARSYINSKTSFGGFAETPELDTLSSLMMSTTDKAIRDTTLGQMAQVYRDNLYVIPIAYANRIFVVSNKVGKWDYKVVNTPPQNWEYVEPSK